MSEGSEEVTGSDVDDQIEVIEVIDDISDDNLQAQMDHMVLDNADESETGREDADLIFTKHTGPVFSVCIDPKDSQLIATGGEDDTAYLWQMSTGNVILQCSGHSDSVTCVTFSHDSSYLATGDMAGDIKVWQVNSCEQVWSVEVGDLEWLQWHPASHVLLAGTSVGVVWMWKIPSGDCRTFPSSVSPCTVGTVMPDGKRACVGHSDGTVKVWDLKTASVTCNFIGYGLHTADVTSLDCHSDNNIIVSGSTDVTAKLLNTQTAKVLHTFDCSGDNAENSVETVGFSKCSTLLATGTLSGDLHVWDSSTQVLRHKCSHQAGVVKLQWHEANPLLYTCTLDGVVHMWDCRTGRRESQWCGHTDLILDFQLAKDGSFIVSSSEDKSARVYSLHTPDR